MPSERINEATRQAWRDLGFFYDRDDEARSWRVVGTTAGFRVFARHVADYAADPSNDVLSEHEHLGPYMYLEIGTWNEPKITDHWIAGSRADLARLAASIQLSVETLDVGDVVSI